MNILPKKRWHVRTKDNIARVRRDEAQARDEEKVRQEKLEYAESEARINFLRKQSGLPEKQSGTIEPTSKVAVVAEGNEHVNLFADYKSHVKTTNKELEKEKKEEQEKYEKQVGYLTYLGQDTNEALKLRSWYEVAPKRALFGDQELVEKDLKIKHAHDPLTLINALLPTEKTASPQPKRKSEFVEAKLAQVAPLPLDVDVQMLHKEKKHKKVKKHKKEKKLKKKKRCKHSNTEKIRQTLAEKYKKEMLNKLRVERLRREACERERQEALLAPKEALKTATSTNAKLPATPRIVQKYNSQFNPELAKQNML